MAKDDHFGGEEAEQEVIYLLEAGEGGDISAGQASYVGAGMGRDSAGGLHTVVEDDVDVVVCQRNQNGDILISSRDGAGAALNVEYEKVIGEVRGIEVRLRRRGRVGVG